MATFRILLLALSNVLVSHGYSKETIKGVPVPNLINATIEDLQTGLNAGLFTSVDLVNAYIARINEVNETVHAVTELNPDAVQIACQLDAERGNGTSRGPLHGIPILIKNNIATNDKMNNTAGSYVLLGAKVPRDATVARKLREAGAIILGKTGLSQWANFRSNNSTNGWSAYGGQVTAAYYPNQDPSGSSSGSGVSSDLGLALASLGTETDGSILSPSNKNNLVGIKPTVGLTSRNLVIPISEHQDTVGPMARTVKDAAILLSAIAGHDPYDNYTSASPFLNTTVPDYAAACDPAALSGARIGIPTNVLSIYSSSSALSPTELTAFNAVALPLLASAGATLVPHANFSAFDQYVASSNESLVLAADFLANLKSYLAALTANPTNASDLAAVRALTRADPREAYPDRDTAVWDAALDEQGWDNADPRFWPAYRSDLFLGGEGGVLGALDRLGLDAVVLPTAVAPGVPALVGSPVVTVPLGFYPRNASVVGSSRGLVDVAPGVPFGLSFLGRRWDEERLVGLAYAFEQRLGARGKGVRYVEPRTEIGDVLEG